MRGAKFDRHICDADALCLKLNYSWFVYLAINTHQRLYRCFVWPSLFL